MLPNNKVILLTDTVGFIRKLPTTLIAAFRATLEELTEASVLVHVVDITIDNATEQFNTVEDILRDLQLAQKPRIIAINKIDLLAPPGQQWDEIKAIQYCLARSGEPLPDTVLISAAKKWGFKTLLNLIAAKLAQVSSDVMVNSAANHQPKLTKNNTTY